MRFWGGYDAAFAFLPAHSPAAEPYCPTGTLSGESPA